MYRTLTSLVHTTQRYTGTWCLLCESWYLMLLNEALRVCPKVLFIYLFGVSYIRVRASSVTHMTFKQKPTYEMSTPSHVLSGAI